MSGAQAIIASLEAEGVDTVFGYPGGQAINIYDALYDSKKLHHVLARHEQGATHMADGYARATGKVGVVLVTSGPGATTTVTRRQPAARRASLIRPRPALRIPRKE